MFANWQVAKPTCLIVYGLTENGWQRSKVNGQSARLKFYGHTSILKPTGREMQPSLQARGSHPARFQDSALTGASGLDPAQRRRAFFSVVVREHDVPQPQNGDRTDNVNQQKAPHNAPLDAHGTSGVADEARGNRLNFRPVKIRMIYLWKSRSKMLYGSGISFGHAARGYNGSCLSSFASSCLPTSTLFGKLTKLVLLQAFPIRERN